MRTCYLCAVLTRTDIVLKVKVIYTTCWELPRTRLRRVWYQKVQYSRTTFIALYPHDIPEISCDASYKTTISELRLWMTTRQRLHWKDIWPDTSHNQSRGVGTTDVSLTRDRSVWNICGRTCFAYCEECKTDKKQFYRLRLTMIAMFW